MSELLKGILILTAVIWDILQLRKLEPKWTVVSPLMNSVFGFLSLSFFFFFFWWYSRYWATCGALRVMIIDNHWWQLFVSEAEPILTSGSPFIDKISLTKLLFSLPLFPLKSVPSADEWRNEAWAVCTWNTRCVYCKKNWRIDHATTWMDLENAMQSPRSQPQKITSHRSPFVASARKRQIQRVRKWVSGYLGLGEGVTLGRGCYSGP